MATPLDREAQLDDLLASYLVAEEEGRAPDRKEWLKGHPQYAVELKAFFADRGQVEGMAQPLKAVARGLDSMRQPTIRREIRLPSITLAKSPAIRPRIPLPSITSARAPANRRPKQSPQPHPPWRVTRFSAFLAAAAWASSTRPAS